MRIIKLTILIFLLTTTHQICATPGYFSLNAIVSGNSNTSDMDSLLFKESTEKKNKIFIGYGILPETNKIGVFNTGYVLDIYKKMSLESSINIYTNERYSLNAIIHFHASIPENRFDLYLGGGIQLLKNLDQLLFSPIISIKGDVNISSNMTVGIGLLQPFLPETTGYLIPGLPFILINAGYKF